MEDSQVRRTFRTCTEHAHCQQEIRITAWDDKPNSHIVIHHRDADLQPGSPLAPENVSPEALRDWLVKINARFDTIEERNTALWEAQPPRAKRRARKAAE